MLKNRLMLCALVTLFIVLFLVSSIYAEEVKVDFTKFKPVTGVWKVVDGGYQTADMGSNNGNAYMELKQEGTELIYEWTIEYVDANFSAFSMAPAAGIHILCSEGASDTRGNSYCIFQDSNFIRVYKSTPTGLSKVTEFIANAAKGETHTYRVEVNIKNGLLKFFRDGKEVGQYKDLVPIESGRYLSLRTNYTNAIFKDIEITMK